MKKNLSVLSSLILSTGCITLTLPVYAQTMDYGSLESLYGEPITTSATGTPQRASEVPATMTIITADEIRQSGSRSIPQIIGLYVPGVFVLQYGVTGYDIGVRGYGQPLQPRLLVLVDGRQVFIDDYSRTPWDNLPVNIDDIRQIEVVKGPSSALFGSNADGGVINIITYSPLYDNNRVASVSYGTQSMLTGDGTVTANGDWGGTKFSAGGLEGDNFTTGTNSSDFPPFKNPEKGYVVNSSVFKIAPDVLINTEFTYADSTTLSSNATAFNLYNENNVTYSARAGLQAQTNYGLISNNNYFNHSFSQLYLNGASAIPFAETTDLLVSQLADQFKIGADHTFRVGVEYRYKNFRDDDALSLPEDTGLAENNFAVSGSWLWQITDHLSLINAARLDHEVLAQTGTPLTGALVPSADYSHDINTWSGNSGLVYKPTDLDTFRISYGRGVELPSLIQNGINITSTTGGNPVNVEGNPRLKPTITQNYELGYDRAIPEIDSTIKLTPFYQINQDIISSPAPAGTVVFNSTPYTVYQSVNIGNSRGWGGELELKGSSPSGFRWDGNYSYARVVDDQSVLNSEDYQGSTPEHHLGLLLGYTTGPWEFDGNTQYMTSTNMRRGNSVFGTTALMANDGYISLGGRVGYKITEVLTVAVSGMNINSSAIHESPYPAVERQGLLMLTGKF